MEDGRRFKDQTKFISDKLHPVLNILRKINVLKIIKTSLEGYL